MTTQPLTERNTRIDGYMPHSIYPNDAARRVHIRRKIQLQHDTGGWAGDILKFDPSVDGVKP